MDRIDQFETIARHVRVEIPKIKGSKFIGDAFPAPTEDQARSHLADIVSEFPDATHHCYAFSVADGEIERSSDDGEPSGTAGPPILRQIESSELRNVLVVVTRYYGGTKLGAGGLIRAYGSAAKAALSASKRVVRVLEVEIKLTFEYTDTSRAMRTIEQFDGRIQSSEYARNSILHVAIPTSRLESFSIAYRDALGARGLIEIDSSD